jgi:hypothetical protein
MTDQLNRHDDREGFEALAGLAAHDMGAARAERLCLGMRRAFDAAHARARWAPAAAAPRVVTALLEPAFLVTVSTSYLLWAALAVLHLWGRK